MANFDFLKGNIDIIILNSLLVGDKYGYEISREIKEKTNQQYEIKQATLYGYLKRLEEQNLIQSYWGEQSNGGRRKYFRLTETGKSVCKEFTAEWNYHKNVLENLVVDDAENESDFIPDKQCGRDKFFGTKLPRSKAIKSDSEIKSISDELKKLTITQAQPEINSTQAHKEQTFDSASFEKTHAEFTETISQARSSIHQDPTAESLHKLFTETQSDSHFYDPRAYSPPEKKHIEITETEFNMHENDAGQANDIAENPDFTYESLHDLFSGIDDVDSNTRQYNAYEKTQSPSAIKPQSPLPRVPNTAPSFDADTLSRMRESFKPQRQQEQSEYKKSDSEHIKQSAINFNAYDRETENQKYYKSTLGELLDDQIVDTDAKIAQLSKDREKTAAPKECDVESTIVDLAEELAKDGVKMRFYNSVTSQYRAVPMLLINKIRCAAAWTTLTVFFALSLLLSISSSNFPAAIYATLVFLIIPVVYTGFWRLRPYSQIKPRHNFKYTFINRLVFFVLSALFVLCFDLILLKTNFSDSSEVFRHFILPMLALFMMPASTVIYTVLLKLKAFYN